MDTTTMSERRSPRARKHVSFQEAIKERAKHPDTLGEHRERHHSTAHDVAVEDGSALPIMHLADVRMGMF